MAGPREKEILRDVYGLGRPIDRIYYRRCRTVPQLGFAEFQDDIDEGTEAREAVSGERPRSRTSIRAARCRTCGACCIRADSSGARRQGGMTFWAYRGIRPCSG